MGSLSSNQSDKCLLYSLFYFQGYHSIWWKSANVHFFIYLVSSAWRTKLTVTLFLVNSSDLLVALFGVILTPAMALGHKNFHFETLVYILLGFCYIYVIYILYILYTYTQTHTHSHKKDNVVHTGLDFLPNLSKRRKSN